MSCSRFPVGSEAADAFNTHMPRRPKGDGYSHLPTGGTGGGLGGKGSGGGIGIGDVGLGGDGVSGIYALPLMNRFYCSHLP